MKALTVAASRAREAAAALLVICAGQFWMQSMGAALDHFKPDSTPAKAEGKGELQAVAQELVTGSQVGGAEKRPDLKQLEQMLAETKKAEQLAKGDEQDEEAEPRARLRRLLVDVGPARSDVYVNGVFAGKTPYVGQVNCLSGAAVKVQVLPPKGMPWTEEVPCQGIEIDASAALRETEEAFDIGATPGQHDGRQGALVPSVQAK